MRPFRTLFPAAPRARLRAWSRQEHVRTLAREMMPVALIVALVWVKISYFNFPPDEVLENDWNRWYLRQAIQAMVGSLGTLLVVLSPLLLLAPGRRLAALWVVNLLASLLVLADVLHFRFYGDIVSLAAAGNGGQLPMIYQSIVGLLQPRDAILFVDLVVALAAWARLRPSVRSAPAPELRPLRRTLARRCLVAGLVLVAVVPVRIVVLDRGETFEYNFFRFFGARKIGLLNYHLYEGGKLATRRFFAGYSVSTQEREQMEAFVDSVRTASTAPSPHFGVARGSNVIIVMVESLQSFPLGLRIAGQEVTPNLNAFARGSLLFDRFYDQTWQGTTSDGEFTALQSLHPLPSGSVETRFSTNQYRGLPEVLAERGYATLSAHAFYGAMWNRREVFPRLGFDEMLFRKDYQITEKIGLGLSDAEFFRQTLPRLEQLPRPFAAYLITLSSHHPYELPEEHRTLHVGELSGTVLGSYLQAVNYTDRAFGEFVEGLRESGLLDESVVVVFGDHKADLGAAADLERLLVRHAGYPPRSAGFDQRYWMAQHQVPLIVHLPGDRAAGVYSNSAGHLDIAPTVLDLLGVSRHEMVALGRVVAGGEDAFVVFRDGGFALGDTLCVRMGTGPDAAECRNTATGAVLDPRRFRSRFAAAGQRLQVSDLLVRADLIPGRPAGSGRVGSGSTATQRSSPPPRPAPGETGG